MYCGSILLVLLWVLANICSSDFQVGPDPWHNKELPVKIEEPNIPSDLRTPSVEVKRTENKLGFGEWWFKRLLAIVLKSGHVKKNEVGSIDISIQMKFDESRWSALEECLKTESSLKDDMFRRAVGYVEEAIYKSTITEQIVMAWSDYIQVYLTEYKTYMTWFFGILGAVGILMWLWKYMSHKQVIVVMFSFLYVYEAYISYKESEQKEYEMFMSAVNSCKWYFWTSECTVPKADLIVFLKHMNPMKIAIRMFVTLISEPVLSIYSTVKVIVQDITDELFYPLNKGMYILLMAAICFFLIYHVVMIVYNKILNIPFKLLNILSIGDRQNTSGVFSTDTLTNTEQQRQSQDMDRISGDRLDRILNVCSLALTNVHTRPNTNMQSTNNTSLPKLKRSASAGRLSTLGELENNNDRLVTVDTIRRRHMPGRGEGDH